MTYPFGKFCPPKEDDRTLQMVSYLPVELPSVPSTCRWDEAMPEYLWGDMGNKQYGVCVWATAGHTEMCARANESADLSQITTEQVLHTAGIYGGLNGYYILDRLKIWRKEGLWGSTITAFAAVDLHDHDVLKVCIHIFGHADIGVRMPLAWDDKESHKWDVGSGAQYKRERNRGHSIPLFGYFRDPFGRLWYVTCSWGMIYFISADAVTAYGDEGYVSILPSWFAKDQVTPSGVNSDRLVSDMRVVTA
jgi:hypothetical protein